MQLSEKTKNGSSQLVEGTEPCPPSLSRPNELELALATESSPCEALLSEEQRRRGASRRGGREEGEELATPTIPSGIVGVAVWRR